MTSGRWLDEVDWWADARLAYAAGLAEAAGMYDLGWLAASEAYGAAIRAALERPDGHGGQALDEATRAIVLDVFRRYCVDPVPLLTNLELPCGCLPLDVLRDHRRLHGALIVDPGNQV